MEINKLLKIGAEKIKGRQYGNPVLEATLLLGKLLKVDRVYIYTHGHEEVPDFIVDKYFEMIDRRRAGYPIQYIIKEREFMGLDFYVEEGVLIPRPDTEILVEYVLEYIDKNYGQQEVEVLDIGIGSGAIGISIAYYRKNARVYGVDISQKALEISNINKERFNLENINIFKSNLFENIDKDKKFHIIASNPPYIPKDHISSLQEEVQYEPVLALDGGKDGLDFYRRIIPESKEYLHPNGLLILEIGYDQGAAVVSIMEEEAFENIEILKDLQGLDRVVLGFKG
ncbi:MAG: peptide chain release factor N(5)-glutamine methyltransferase [Tissierellia bacterium]|mgnify:CR=1 FL=1|nr:peptide chain release factor N(5)-glutamine methyltransferase [Tissierellia bacterium]